ncbi:MAG TPA: glycosyl hydrolase family 18 protein [Tepidisphaeraceae bacterium]|jgi:chitinase|nr:glycosyl hydrolase family 18 protein [Tepidisphaeraceae bacterium]
MSKRRAPSLRIIEPLESRLFLSSTQLIRNGGFEGAVSASDWSPTGSFYADSRFTNFHTGAGYAYLSTSTGSAGNSLIGALSQSLTIPSATTSLTFSFWSKITTSETTTTAANDTMTINVMDSTGTTLLQSLTTLSNLNASSSYVQKTFSLNRSLISQTVRIVFSAATDAALPTTFRVDDVSLNAVSPATHNRVVGYLPEYRYSSFSKMDLTALTHANYFSISANNDGSLSTGGVVSADLDAAVAALHAAGVTVSITVGPISFSTLAASATARSAFANNIVTYALAHNLDGVDIDWEPPAANNNPAYGSLISDLYAVAHPQHMLITAAVNPWTNEIPAATVNADMDWLNVMCYDFAPANHSTYTDSVGGLTDWLNYGVTKNKLVMGVPFYGRSGTTWSNTVTESYTTIVSNYYALHGVYPSPDLDSYVDSSGATYYFNGVTTIEQKAAYVRDNNYGGMMIWELGMDHWNASNQYDTSSLLPVIKAMMNPPTWITPAAGSHLDLVANTLYLHAGSATLTADALSSYPNLNISLSANTTLLLSSTEHLGSLTIANGATVTLNSAGTNTLLLTSLSIPGTGKLDLKNNSLILNYTGSSPISTLLPLLSSAHGTGSWTGTGITSSTAAADPSHNTAIGYADSSSLGLTTFAGQPVDSTSLLFRYTYYGDTDLNGSVTADDLARIDRGSAKHLTGWLNGDFNYDNAITTADYTLLDKVFAAQSAPIADPETSTPAVAAPTILTITPLIVPPPPPFSAPTHATTHKPVTFQITLPASTSKHLIRYTLDWNNDGHPDQILTALPGATLHLRHLFSKSGTYLPTLHILNTNKYRRLRIHIT